MKILFLNMLSVSFFTTVFIGVFFMVVEDLQTTSLSQKENNSKSKKANFSKVEKSF